MHKEKKKFKVVIARSETMELEFEIEVGPEFHGHQQLIAYDEALKKAYNTEFPRSGNAHYEVISNEEMK